MARTVIDLDEKTVAEVMEIFGTNVKAQAVRAALEDVVKRRRRQVGIDRELRSFLSGFDYLPCDDEAWTRALHLRGRRTRQPSRPVHNRSTHLRCRRTSRGHGAAL